MPTRLVFRTRPGVSHATVRPVDELTNAICKSVRVPVIASGGCGEASHMLDVFKKADVDAALAASIFHYEKSTVDKVKKYLKRNGVRIRL